MISCSCVSYTITTQRSFVDIAQSMSREREREFGRESGPVRQRDANHLITIDLPFDNQFVVLTSVLFFSLVDTRHI
jgi:hypothetical protein